MLDRQNKTTRESAGTASASPVRYSAREDIPLGDLEIKLQDILHAMQNAMRHHQVSHCESCFDRLSDAMMKIDQMPESADHTLDDWIAKTRMHRISHGCTHCYMPVYPAA